MVADALSRPPLPESELYHVSDQHVREELAKWLALVAPHVQLSDVLDGARDSLAAGRKLCAIRCPHCSSLQIDLGKRATRKHVEHVCSRDGCGR